MSPLEESPNKTFSSAVFQGSNTKFWKIMAISLLGPVITWSRNFMAPEVGLFRPAIIRRRVDLPQPDGPVIATSSSLLAVKETSTRTGICSFSFRKSSETCSTEMIGDEEMAGDGGTLRS